MLCKMAETRDNKRKLKSASFQSDHQKLVSCPLSNSGNRETNPTRPILSKFPQDNPARVCLHFLPVGCSEQPEEESWVCGAGGVSHVERTGSRPSQQNQQHVQSHRDIFPVEFLFSYYVTMRKRIIVTWLTFIKFLAICQAQVLKPHQILRYPSEIGTVSISQMSKLRPRELRDLPKVTQPAGWI